MGELDELKDKFLEYLEIEKGRSPYSARNYDFYLQRFFNIMQPEKVEDISPLLIRKYKLELSRLTDARGEFLKKSTINYHLIALRTFLRYLITQEDFIATPPDKVELVKSEESRVSVLDSDSLDRLLAQPNLQTMQGLRDLAILEMLFSTGLRVAELLSLNVSDINFKSGEISVLGKGKRVRVVFISKKAEWSLKAYLARRRDEYKPLFVRFKGGKTDDHRGENLRLSARSIQKMIKINAQKAGLALEPTPHTLRHTFATDLLRHGADLRSVQEMLGHKNVATTQRYTHITNLQLKTIHKRFHAGNLEESPPVVSP